MKILLNTLCIFILLNDASAQYLPLDSARRLLQVADTPEEKFRALQSIDRHYYSNGLHDSSSNVQKQMFALAIHSKKDSLLTPTYRAIGNRYLSAGDYNFAMVNYIKGMEYADNDFQRLRIYASMAYVYTLMENNVLAMQYLRKAEALLHDDDTPFYIEVFFGAVYNNLLQPDSALISLRKAELIKDANNDRTFNSMLLGQIGRAYDLKNDTALAMVYYNKAIDYCIKENLSFSFQRQGKLYTDFLLRSGNYTEAYKIGTYILQEAKKSGGIDGTRIGAAVLRKYFVHTGDKDSALFYSEMQMAYNDSMNSQRRLAELQNMTFAQQLREMDEETKREEARKQRNQNIQYVLIALAIVSFIILFFILSQSIIVNERWISFFGILGLLIVFEFINLLIHPFLESITHHSPILMLLALVIIASLLIPLHHRLEKWIRTKMTEKNRKIKLEAARKTIERLEGEVKE